MTRRGDITEADVIKAWREATPVGAPLAARFYAADMEQMRLHSDVFDLLESVFGDGAVDDFSADYYDRSIEVFLGSRPAKLPSLSPLAEQGFRLLWIHSVADGCVMPRGECRCQSVGLSRAHERDSERAR